MEPSLTLFTVWMVLGIICAAGIQLLVWRLSAHKVLITVLSFISTAQLGWLLSYVLLGGTVIQGYTYMFSVEYIAEPFQVIFSILAVPLGCLLVVLAYWLLARPAGRPPLAIESLCPERPAHILCNIGAVAPLIYYVVMAMPSVPLFTPILAYVHFSLSMVPFALGRYGAAFKVQRKIFFVCASITAAIALAEGSRSLVFLPCAYFVLGWLSSQTGRRRFVAAAISLLLSPAIFYASQLLQDLRGDVRAGGKIESRQGIGLMIESSRQGVQAELPLATVAAGVGRMVNWANVVVGSVVPEEVPYRGFNDLPDEIRMLARTTLLGASGTNQIDDQISIEVGQGSAGVYGFAISSGGTVPFPVIADAWQRGGFAGGVAIGAILGGVFLFCEILIFRIFSSMRFLPVVMLAVMASAAYDRANSYGFVYTARFSLTTMVFWLVPMIPWMNLAGLVSPTLPGRHRIPKPAPFQDGKHGTARRRSARFLPEA